MNKVLPFMAFLCSWGDENRKIERKQGNFQVFNVCLGNKSNESSEDRGISLGWSGWGVCIDDDTEFQKGARKLENVEE